MFINIVSLLAHMEFDELLITTGVDSLVRLVKQKRKVELPEASSLLNIPEDTIEEWARVLEEEGIIRIEYRLARIFLVWVPPTAEEIAEEKESFYREKEEIVKEIEKIRKRMPTQEKEVAELKNTFENAYKRIKSRLEELEKSVVPVAATGLVTKEGMEAKKEKMQEYIDSVDELRKSVSSISKEIEGISKELGEKKGKKAVKKAELLLADLQKMRKDLEALREKGYGKLPPGIELPSPKDMRTKFQTLMKEFKELQKRNASLRDSIRELEESSGIVKEVGKSMKDYEKDIRKMKKDVSAMKEEADALAKKSADVSERIREDFETLERFADSMEVAKGIVGRFPSKKGMLAELEEIRKGEKRIAEKSEAIKKLLKATTGKGVGAKEVRSLTRKIDDTLSDLNDEVENLSAALEDEKSTFLTYQRIRERVVPSLESYRKRIVLLLNELKKARHETIEERKALTEGMKSLQEKIKKGEMKGAVNIISEVKEKSGELEKVRSSLYDLANTADNLSKRVTLLARQAKLLELRAGAAPAKEAAAPAEVRKELELTKEEEMEFRRKREELKKLIKKLWEES